MSIQWNWLKSMSSFLKKNGIQTPQVGGGIHPTMYPDLTIAHESIDIICKAEGDYAILAYNLPRKNYYQENIKKRWGIDAEVIYSIDTSRTLKNLIVPSELVQSKISKL